MRALCLSFLVALFASGCASGGRLRGGMDGADLVKVARKQIGAKYHFGGASPSKGFDCSGLVQYCFGTFGVKLSHSTSQLYGEGHKVSKGDLEPGDLVFFDISGSGPSHVGIYSGADKMIHAPSTGSKVREESIAIKYWVKRYLTAKRLD